MQTGCHFDVVDVHQDLRKAIFHVKRTCAIETHTSQKKRTENTSIGTIQSPTGRTCGSGELNVGKHQKRRKTIRLDKHIHLQP